MRYLLALLVVGGSLAGTIWLHQYRVPREVGGDGISVVVAQQRPAWCVWAATGLLLGGFGAATALTRPR